MAAAVIALEAAFLGAAFGYRTVVQVRRTGDTAWRLRSEGLADAAGKVALLVALAVAVPLADLAGLPRWSALDRPAVATAGLALMVAGTTLTVWAQIAIGASWRIGVDRSERTALVTQRPFDLVRNPIYTAMLVALVGLALALPNLLAAILLVVSLAALEMQVRGVEEPHLLASHPQEYAEYVARTGRFVPGVGRRPSA